MIIRKTILVAICLNTGYASFSQDCNLALKDGSKMTVNAYGWTNPNLYDPKFQKLKADKKDEQILAYNQSLVSGKLAPARTFPMTFSVKKAAPETGAGEYTLTTNIAGKDYSSYAQCKGDTIYFYRNKGVVDLPDGKGGSLGFTIQSPQKLPMNIKIGDKLPPYDDISFLYPRASDKKEKIMVTKVVGAGTNDAAIVWSTYDVNVRQTLNFSSRLIHYVNAEVTGEEETVIGGAKYKAYVIESETWNKGNMNVSYETDYKDVNENFAKGVEKMQNRFDKMMLRKEITNQLGYAVSYLKEWYVPALGIVKSESYDNLGGIAGGMTIIAIE